MRDIELGGADVTTDPFFGMYWVHVCGDAQEARPICYAFLRGIQGVNELLTATKRPLWCEPVAIVVSPEQMRVIFLRTLSDEAANLHDEPAAGIAILGLIRAFPYQKIVKK